MCMNWLFSFYTVYRGSSRYFTTNWFTYGNTIQFESDGRRFVTQNKFVQVWKSWCRSSDNLFITIANFLFVSSDGKNKFEAYREFTQVNGRPFIRAIIKCRIEYLGEMIFDLNESYAYGDPRKLMAYIFILWWTNFIWIFNHICIYPFRLLWEFNRWINNIRWCQLLIDRFKTSKHKLKSMDKKWDLHATKYLSKYLWKRKIGSDGSSFGHLADLNMRKKVFECVYERNVWMKI